MTDTDDLVFTVANVEFYEAEMTTSSNKISGQVNLQIPASTFIEQIIIEAVCFEHVVELKRAAGPIYQSKTHVLGRNVISLWSGKIGIIDYQEYPFEFDLQSSDTSIAKRSTFRLKSENENHLSTIYFINVWIKEAGDQEFRLFCRQEFPVSQKSFMSPTTITHLNQSINVSTRVKRPRRRRPFYLIFSKRFSEIRIEAERSWAHFGEPFQLQLTIDPPLSDLNNEIICYLKLTRIITVNGIELERQVLLGEATTLSVTLRRQFTLQIAESTVDAPFPESTNNNDTNQLISCEYILSVEIGTRWTTQAHLQLPINLFNPVAKSYRRLDSSRSAFSFMSTKLLTDSLEMPQINI